MRSAEIGKLRETCWGGWWENDKFLFWLLLKFQVRVTNRDRVDDWKTCSRNTSWSGSEVELFYLLGWFFFFFFLSFFWTPAE
jgi:hypothetical protein